MSLVTSHYTYRIKNYNNFDSRENFWFKNEKDTTFYWTIANFFEL